MLRTDWLSGGIATLNAAMTDQVRRGHARACVHRLLRANLEQLPNSWHRLVDNIREALDPDKQAAGDIP